MKDEMSYLAEMLHWRKQALRIEEAYWKILYELREEIAAAELDDTKGCTNEYVAGLKQALRIVRFARGLEDEST